MHPTSRRKNRNKRNKHVVQNNFHSGNQNNATGKDENLFEERRDSELFFFDIAGNKYDLDRVPPYISKKRPINRLQQNTTKNFNFRHNRNKKKKNKLLRKVNPETSITSEADTIKNVNNNLRDVNIIKVPRKKKKRKKHKLNELEDIEIYNARYNVTDFGTQTESNLDKNTTTSSGLPFNAKENKEKNIDASIDIRNSDCEVMNYSISGNKRRDKKVDKAGQNDSIKETTLKDNAKHSNSEMYNSHENHVSEMFLENDNPNYDLLEKCNRENNALLNYNSNNLHVNGGDHLNHFSSSRKKKKKKDYLQSADEQDIVTPSASFKPSYLIDIRDSDCEVSTEVVDTEVLIPLKKKKKKHRVNECTAGFISECKTELDNMNCNNREIKKGTLLDNDSFNNVALNDRTKLSSDERKIIDLIKGDILFSFKKKKKKRSPQKETCDVNSDELTYGKHNGVYNSFNNGTSTEQDSTEPDIDNECEMMIINDSHKKKKDNRTRPGHTNKDDSVAKKDWKNDSFITDIKVINKANVSEDAEIQRTFVTNHSPDSRIKRKNKKHKIDSIEIDSDLEDITLASIDLDSSSNASDLSKSNTSRSVLESMHNAANSFPDSCNEDDHRSNDTGKKKKRGLQNESSELEAISTPKKKHKKPSNDNVRTEDSEIHLLVDIRDSECEMTTSYYNSNSKKPKKNKSKVNDSTTAFNNSTANLQKEQFEAVRREKYKKKKTNRHSEKNIFSGLDNNEDNSERTLKPQRDRDADDLEEIMNPGIDVFSSLEEGIADGVDKENNGMVTFCNSDGKRKKKKDRYNLEDDNQNKNDLEEISQTEDKKSIRKNHKPKDNRVYNKVTDDHDCDKGKVVSGNDKFIGKINDDSVEDRISENSEKCKRKRQGEKHWQLLGNEEQANEDLHQSDSISTTDVDEATPCDESGKTNINAASASSWLSEDEETEFEEEVYKWRRLPIVLPFTVCPLHAILTRASYPTKEQSEEIIKRNLEVKNGPFSQAEDEKILGNWKRFCEEYNFKMIPKAFIPFPRGVNPDQRLIFLRYISHGLDNRLIHRVYRRFKLIMSKDKLKLGRFTPEEDHQILEYMKNTTSPHPFSDLSKSLSRTNNSLFKRYRRLILAKHETVHWKPGLIKPFLKHLKKITKCSDLNDLQYRKVSVKEWRKLSKKMVPIPMWKLQLAWESYIYPRLFIDETVDMKEIKAKIIKRLIKRNESDWRAVDWRKITKKFPGFTSTKIYNMFKQLVIFHVPKEKQKNLKECLNFLEEKLLKSNKIPTTHPFKKIKHEMNDE